MRWKFLLPLFVFLVICGFLFKGLYMDPRIVPSALIDKPAPDFSLPSMTVPGKMVSKKDLLGRVYLINVWGSWCPACMEEHPYLVKLKKMGEKFYLVGYVWPQKDKNESIDSAVAREKRASIEFMQQAGNPFDQVMIDNTDHTVIDFGVTGAPETFVIDKKGNIRYKEIGMITPEVWAKKIKPLLAQLEAEN